MQAQAELPSRRKNDMAVRTTRSAAMLSLVIVDHEAGVNDAGNPAEKGQQNAEKKTEDPSSHQDSHRRKDDAEEIAERFHSI